MPLLLSIVMVSYNSEEHIISALGSVYSQTGFSSFEIIVVDNASVDDTVMKIREKFPMVRIIQSDRNLGFAGGVHLGVAESQGKFLLLINPDTVILDSAIDRLLEFSEINPNNGIWSGITLHKDMNLDSEHAWTKPTFTALLFFAFGLNRLFPHSSLFNKINYGGWSRDTVREVDIVSGCFFLTTRELWSRLNGFDPAFFLYAEEADYCLRAKKIGFHPIVTPDAKVIHLGGASHNLFSNKMIYLLKGKIELIHRHVDSWKQPVYKFLLFLYVLNNNVVHSILAPRSEKQKEWRMVFKKRKEWLNGFSS
jgi:N-acetylglucosaminyl-diphospho-decaprenol L-rhamnosyltransferase